jgi:membrane associated rhomboid family serine protease
MTARTKLLVRLLVLLGYSFFHCEAFQNSLRAPLLCAPRIILNPLEQYRQQLTRRVVTGVASHRFPEYWPGDDLRLFSKVRRRFRALLQRHPARTAIMTACAAMFAYQTMTTVDWFRRRHPGYWPQEAVTILVDTVWGSALPGPLTMNFGIFKGTSAYFHNNHCYLTSGFVHGGIAQLIINMDALRRLPAWLESIDVSLYVTCYIVSIVTGTLAHVLWSSSTSANSLGASGGICGLLGLLYVLLARMGNEQAFTRVATTMGRMLVYGLVFANTSNASNVGGLVGGVLVGVLFGPTFPKSYAMRRKNSLEVDYLSKDLRFAMGYDRRIAAGWLPIQALWVLVAAGFVIVPSWRSIPKLIWQGMVHPGRIIG